MATVPPELRQPAAQPPQLSKEELRRLAQRH
jgi:hypothetical protein